MKKNDDYIEEATIYFKKLLAKRRNSEYERMMKEQKGESFVLHYIFSQNRAVLPSEISGALESSAARISAILSVLEKKQLLERSIDESNRRNILVTITEKGITRVESEKKKWDKILAAIFLEMGEQDTREYLRLGSLFTELISKHVSVEDKNE